MYRQARPRSSAPVWHGSAQEAAELVRAALLYCTCSAHPYDTLACAAHGLIFTNQRTLDGLLFARRMRDRFRAAEFGVVPTDPIAAAARTPNEPKS